MDSKTNTTGGKYVPIVEEEAAAAAAASAPETIAEAILVPPKQHQYVELVAPADLPEHYELTVQLDDGGGGGGGTGILTTGVVLVPEGGVTKGHCFRALVVSKQSAAAVKADPTDTSGANNPHHIPYGGWRDGCCDCCILSCCHPSCFLSFFCLPVQLGQLLTRMKLGLLGNPNPAVHSRGLYWTPFKVLVAAWIGYVLLALFVNSLTSPYMEDYVPDDSDPFNSTGGLSPNAPGWVAFVLALNNVVGLAFGLYLLVLIIKTRSYIRRTYNIPGDGCEDCCCAYWCHGCTVSQMARHTADYRTYSAACCSETGLGERIPPTLDPSIV